jgi:UDP-N-acetylmuramyl pentapeptide phosphotransferase/UDP-N-acetylglucosamine-1-phosphate transferase
MSFSLFIELTLACAILSAGATGAALWWLARHYVMDQPNERSSHDTPIPRGGGIALVPMILVFWLMLVILGAVPLETLAAVAAAAGLTYVGFQDDRFGLGIGPRLAAQFAAILIGLIFLPGHGTVFQGLLPVWADLLASGLLWLWFVNLFNFMDGIDGITATETVALGTGVALIALFSGDHDTGGLTLGIVLAAVALGFLPWNWHPAKLFLGDAGSIPLGYLGGWLLLGLAGRGLWAPALILPLYYLVDASFTLLTRMLRRRRFWEGHREHIYQRAVELGRSHASVVLRILAGNAGLILLALLAIVWPWVGVVLAVCLVVALIVHLLRLPTPRPV